MGLSGHMCFYLGLFSHNVVAAHGKRPEDHLTTEDPSMILALANVSTISPHALTDRLMVVGVRLRQI